MYKLLGKILLISIIFLVLISFLPQSAIDGIRTVGNNAWQWTVSQFNNQSQDNQQENNIKENNNENEEAQNL